MNQVTVSPKYQVVIPKDVRDKIGLKAGMKMEVVTFGNRIELIPIEPIQNLRGFLNGIDTNIIRETDRF